MADEKSFQSLQVTNRPIIVVINKIDLLSNCSSQFISSTPKRDSLFKRKILKKKLKMGKEEGQEGGVVKSETNMDVNKDKIEDRKEATNSGTESQSLVSEYMRRLAMDEGMDGSTTTAEGDENGSSKMTRSIDEIISLWQARLPKAEILTLSVLKNESGGVPLLLERLVHHLPEGPKFFPDDEVIWFE